MPGPELRNSDGRSSWTLITLPVDQSIRDVQSTNSYHIPSSSCVPGNAACTRHGTAHSDMTVTVPVLLVTTARRAEFQHVSVSSRVDSKEQALLGVHSAPGTPTPRSAEE